MRAGAIAFAFESGKSPFKNPIKISRIQHATETIHP